MVAPKRPQGVGHQQDLKGDEAADHPKAHGAHEEQERKGNDGDPAKAGGDAAHVRLAVDVAVVVAVTDGGDLKEPVVDGGGAKPKSTPTPANGWPSIETEDEATTAKAMHDTIVRLTMRST